MGGGGGSFQDYTIPIMKPQGFEYASMFQMHKPFNHADTSVGDLELHYLSDWTPSRKISKDADYASLEFWVEVPEQYKLNPQT